MRGDLKDTRLIYLKGFLFLGMALAASIVLLCRHPDFQTALLLAIAVWASARFYYFAFYVIENYVDHRYRFSGLIDFAIYVFLGSKPDERRRKQNDQDE